MRDLGTALASLGLEPEAVAGGWVVRVPSAKRGPVPVRVEPRERTVALGAFLLRAPDRAREEVYRRMLRRHLGPGRWRFALDADGDIHLQATVTGPLDAAALDELLGELALTVDETYEGLVRTGFDVPAATVFTPPPA